MMWLITGLKKAKFCSLGVQNALMLAYFHGLTYVQPHFGKAEKPSDHLKR